VKAVKSSINKSRFFESIFTAESAGFFPMMNSSSRSSNSCSAAAAIAVADAADAAAAASDDALTELAKAVVRAADEARAGVGA